MKKNSLCAMIIQKILAVIIIILTGLILWPLAMSAQMCMPITNTPINVDGIVVGTAVGGGGALPVGCSVDAGWQNVVGQPFTVFGTPGTASASIYIAGYNATADATLDKIFIGVHVEGDPELDANDRLVIYFHAGGAGAWSSTNDFALFYEVGSLTPPSDESCNQNYGTMQFYRYTGGSWVAQGSVPGSILSKVSRDYDPTNDGESEIWELEISVDLAGMALSIPSSGTGFGIGAKLYVEQATAGLSTVWIWPNNLTTESNPFLYDPNNGSVTPSNLLYINTGNCADVAFDPDPTSGVTATDNNGTSNQFTRLNVPGDFSEQTPLKHNYFTARVKIYNPSNPADNSPLTLSSPGHVNFYIDPWNGDFLGYYLMNNPQINFTHLNQTETVHFDWPQTRNQYDNPSTHQPMNHLAASQHSCLDVQLSGFNPNSNVTNDRSWRNLTYGTSSTIRDTFMIKADVNAPTSGNGFVNYILRANWKNVSQNTSKLLSSTMTQSSPSVSGSNISRGNASGKTVAVVDRKDNRHGRYDDWGCTFANANQLGLHDMGNGYYSMQLKPGETKYVAVEIVGGSMPATPYQYTLFADAGGTILPTPSGKPPLLIDVEAGKMVTIIANGMIRVESQKNLNSPNGFSIPEWTGSRFLLDTGYYVPSQNIGAIIGSFDNFKTSFVVGADMTFLVPQGASKLYLAVNDTVGAYNDNTGEFQINFIMTEPLYLPTRNAAAGNPVIGLPARPRVGSNLPELDINVYQAVDSIGGKPAKLMKPTGYVAYGIYNSHPEFKPAMFELVLPFIGYTTFNKNLGLDDGIVIGARIGHNFAYGLSSEIECGITFTKSVAGKSGNVIQLLANIRYDIASFLLWQKWVTTYATGGIGKMYFSGFGTNTNYWVRQLGAGATLDLNSWMGIRVDARFFNIGNFAGSKNAQVTAGLVFWF